MKLFQHPESTYSLSVTSDSLPLDEDPYTWSSWVEVRDGISKYVGSATRWMKSPNFGSKLFEVS